MKSDIYNDPSKTCLIYQCYSYTDLLRHNTNHSDIYVFIMYFPWDLVKIGFCDQKQDTHHPPHRNFSKLAFSRENHHPSDKNVNCVIQLIVSCKHHRPFVNFEIPLQQKHEDLVLIIKLIIWNHCTLHCGCTWNEGRKFIFPTGKTYLIKPGFRLPA